MSLGRQVASRSWWGKGWLTDILVKTDSSSDRTDRYMVDILIPKGKTWGKNGVIDPNQGEILAKLNSTSS